MFHKALLVLIQMVGVGALLEGSLIRPSTSELLSLINQMNQSCQMEISTLRQELQFMKQTDIPALQQELQILKQTEIPALQHELQILKQSVNTTVSFSATLTNNKDLLGDGQVIIYDHVLANIGTGYEPRHGHFTAPVAGSYHFSVTAMGKPGSLLSVHLNKNGNLVVDIYSDSTGAGYEVGSESIVLYLNTGDMIWVSYGGGARYIHGDHYNSFSGFLIK